MVVRIRDGRLETVRQVRYLGVRWIEEGMRGDKHVVEVGNKVTSLMSVLFCKRDSSGERIGV